MTTATLLPQQQQQQQQPRVLQSSSGTVVHRRGPTILKRPRYHENAKKTPLPASKPVLLRNLRNYYARRRPSMSISHKAMAAVDEAAADSKKVQFFPRVRVKRIPSRFSYSAQDRLSLWVPKKELKQMVVRNHAESAFEGQDWQQAPEEDEFGQRNGQLVHPFYVWAEQEAAASSEEESEGENEQDSASSCSSLPQDE